LPRLQVRTKTRQHEYKIAIGRGILSGAGKAARERFGSPSQRIAVISNRKVFSLYGPVLLRSLQSSGFATPHWLMRDGERYKSIQTAEEALNFLSKNGIERGDALIAMGGGVVGDLAGFVAATYLRGIPFIQVPTTLLAQIDSSVGGKTGVNLPTGKNLVGCFHQPDAVIVDIETLTTLPPRELVAGWCETIKQGAVGSMELFNQTTAFLGKIDSRNVLISSKMEKLVAAHCAFKASIVAADERENVARRDRRSRRILNFGHTIGHALEAVTSYRRFRHGEAVGHGILVAGELSKNMGLLDESELELLRHGVSLCGPLPSAKDLDETAILNAIARDKKRARGYIQWVLLEGIGQPTIVDGKEIGQNLLKQSVRNSLR